MKSSLSNLTLLLLDKRAIAGFMVLARMVGTYHIKKSYQITSITAILV